MAVVILLVMVIAIGAAVPALLAFLRPKFVVHKAKHSAVIVTGTSSGIGKDAAVTLVKKGYTVFGTVRKEVDAQSVLDELSEGSKGTFVPVIMDVTNSEQIAAAKSFVIKHMEENNLKLAGLVNNAGMDMAQFIEAVDLVAARRLFDVNTFGLIEVTQTFLPTLRKDFGRIVNMGSLAGTTARPTSGIYSASKFALEALSDAMRRELVDAGVSVSLIEPGLVTSPMANEVEANAHKWMKNELKKLGLDDVEAYKTILKHRAKISLNFDASKTEGPRETTSVAIVDALQNAQPKSRYPVSSYGPFPGWMLAISAGVLPDIAMDFICRTF